MLLVPFLTMAQDPIITNQGATNRGNRDLGSRIVDRQLNIPVNTGTQADVYTSIPKLGAIRINSTTNRFEYHNGTAWVETGSGGGSVDQDNKFKKIYYQYTTSNPPNVTQLATLLNNGNQFIITDKEIPIIQVSSLYAPAVVGYVPEIRKYVLLNKGKGTYGLGGNIIITPFDLELLYHQKMAYEDYIEYASTQTINMGSTPITNISDAVNNASPNLSIQEQTDGYVVFVSNNGEREVYHLFLGVGGQYGLDAEQTTINDFLEIPSNTFLINENQNLQETLEQGSIGVVETPIFIGNLFDPINSNIRGIGINNDYVFLNNVTSNEEISNENFIGINKNITIEAKTTDLINGGDTVSIITTTKDDISLYSGIDNSDMSISSNITIGKDYIDINTGENLFLNKQGEPFNQEATIEITKNLVLDINSGKVLLRDSDIPTGNFIPLSGTETGSPVTGDIEFEGKSKNLFVKGVDGESNIQLATNTISLTSKNNTTNTTNNINFGNSNSFLINSDNKNFKGLVGGQYYGQNYDNNTYVQKKYVDDAIAAIPGGGTPPLEEVLNEGNNSTTPIQLNGTPYLIADSSNNVLGGILGSTNSISFFSSSNSFTINNSLGGQIGFINGNANFNSNGDLLLSGDKFTLNAIKIKLGTDLTTDNTVIKGLALNTDNTLVEFDIPTGSSLTLGETSTTAYRGDRGKEAYDFSKLITTQGDIIGGGTSGLPTRINPSSTNVVLRGGTGQTPNWAKLNLPTDVTGTLSVANGGIGRASFTSTNSIVLSGTTSTGALQTLPNNTAGTALFSNGTATPSFRNISIADVSNLQTTLNGKANDADVLHKAGNETATGLKTFTNGLKIGTIKLESVGNNNFNINADVNSIDPLVIRSVVLSSGDIDFPNRIGARTKPNGIPIITLPEWTTDLDYTDGLADVANILGYDNVNNQEGSVLIGNHNFMPFHVQGHGVMLGGSYNINAGGRSTIVSGQLNLIRKTANNYAFIGQGYNNLAEFDFATILNGYQNKATNVAATVIGGTDVEAGGDHSLAWGLSSSALGDFSMAFGRKAKSNARGSYTFTDSQNVDFISEIQDSFNARFRGGFFLKEGILHTNSSADGGGLQLDSRSSNNNSRNWQFVNDVESFGDMVIRRSTDNTPSAWENMMYFHLNGNIGFGTILPTEKLDVAGKGKFSGTVSGADATANNEFVTLGQTAKFYTRTGSTAPTAASLSSDYPNDALGTRVFYDSVGSGMLYIKTAENGTLDDWYSSPLTKLN